MNHILLLNILRICVTSLSKFEKQYAAILMTFHTKCITLIVPWDNYGHFESNALIVQDKMESGGQSQRGSRQGRPSHLTKPSNVTDREERKFCKSSQLQNSKFAGS